MHTVATVLLMVAAILAVSAQQYQQSDANYVDEYAGYDAPRAGQPTARSYAPDSAPSRQTTAPAAPKPTPVAILKQINRHNEDGSYTYGFEGGDGSFKIETKLPTGEVKGKYGFVDDTGKVRVVEYGANQYGFQPAGEGITVAPPTLIDETTGKDALQAQLQEDYQQEVSKPGTVPAQMPHHRPAPHPQYDPSLYQPHTHTQAVYTQQQAPSQQTLPKPPIFTPVAPAIPKPNFPTQSVLQQHEETPPPSQLYNQGPAQFGPAPVQEHRSQPQPRSQSGGILDQLAKDFALPQGVAPPLHDISFGYY